jgi:hypothetical protein
MLGNATKSVRILALSGFKVLAGFVVLTRVWDLFTEAAVWRFV